MNEHFDRAFEKFNEGFEEAAEGFKRVATEPQTTIPKTGYINVNLKNQRVLTFCTLIGRAFQMLFTGKTTIRIKRR